MFIGQPVAPRTDRSHACSSKRNGVKTVQIQLSGKLRAFNAAVEEVEGVYQNRLPAENIKALEEALPQLVRP